ncbi:MAG: polysaccharide deacetylase family protein [Pyrinomonadaceae bacterium]
MLCYHGVTQRTSRAAADRFGLHVREDRFRKQLEYLSHNFRVISFRDYLRARNENLKLPNYSALITFDDGHRNFYTTAAPLLESYNMRAVMFLISDRVVDEGFRLSDWNESDDQEYLSWAEAGDLTKRGFEFGSHTRSHRKLPQLLAVEVEGELIDSKIAIETQLATDGLPLAYPYGMTTDAIAARAAALGYVCAFTSDTGFNDSDTNAFKLHRTLIGDDDDRAAFAARVAGLTR